MLIQLQLCRGKWQRISRVQVANHSVPSMLLQCYFKENFFQSSVSEISSDMINLMWGNCELKQVLVWASSCNMNS